MTISPRRALPLLLTVPGLALGACGGTSDSGKITDLIKKIDKDPAALCDNSTSKLLSQLGGGGEKCKTAARGYSNNAHITGDIKVSVSGDKASATFKTSDGKTDHPTFVKQGGKWLIDSAG